MPIKKSNKVISRSQLYTLRGLRYASDRLSSQISELRGIACEITGEEDDMGATADYIWGSFDPEGNELLKRLGITVEKKARKRWPMKAQKSR